MLSRKRDSFAARRIVARLCKHRQWSKAPIAARKEVMKLTGYPKGRKGDVVDHIIPLECGGADAPANMQWQTIADAKIRDRTERNCRR